MFGNYEGRVVFDRYMDQSLKNKTRQHRAATSIEFPLYPEMKLTISLKEILSRLVWHLCSLRVCWNTSLVRVALSWLLCTTPRLGAMVLKKFIHIRADSLIRHQFFTSIGSSAWWEVCAWSLSTDVLLFFFDLVSCGRIGDQTLLKFLSGKGTKYREGDVVEFAWLDINNVKGSLDSTIYETLIGEENSLV